MVSPQTFDPLGTYFDPGLTQEHVGQQAAAHADLAMNAHMDSEFLLPRAPRAKTARADRHYRPMYRRDRTEKRVLDAAWFEFS